MTATPASEASADPRTVAGVDGCRAGWLVVTHGIASPASAAAFLCPTFAEVLHRTRFARVVAIDMPIGLPERASIGGRAADAAARANLGDRRSAVFSVPARAAVMEHDYARACAVALTASDPPRKISKQIFNLFPRIREVDGVMTPDLQSRVVECHPEVAFWLMNGEIPLSLPKKVKSRPFEPGLALRRALLVAAGYPTARLGDGHWRAADAGPDDLLDAAACAWTAARIATGHGCRFPSEPPRDGKGLRMEIWG